MNDNLLKELKSLSEFTYSAGFCRSHIPVLCLWREVMRDTVYYIWICDLEIISFKNILQHTVGVQGNAF